MKLLAAQFLSRVQNTRSEGTWKTYSVILGEVFGIIDEVSPDTLDELLKLWKSKGLSQNSVVLKLSVVSSYLRFVNRKMTIEHYDEIQDILGSVKRNRKEQEYINEPTVRKLIDAARGIRYKAIISLGFYCGLRISEILSLETSDIFEDCCIVRNTKSHEDRKVLFLSDILKANLALYRKQYDPQGKMFDVKQNSLQCYFKELCVAQGFPKLHFHSLRGSFVRAMLDADVSLPVIQRFTGHSSLQSLQAYTSITPKMMEKANIFDH
jgi:integrase